jgi:hypothetical protein
MQQQGMQQQGMQQQDMQQQGMQQQLQHPLATATMCAPAAALNWTAEEDATLLAHLAANRWSCSNFSGKPMFTVTQGAGALILAAASGMCDRMYVLRVTRIDTHALCVHPAAAGLPNRSKKAIRTRATRLSKKMPLLYESVSWTAEEDATLLAYLEANRWPCSNFSGKHMSTVTQGVREGGGARTPLVVWRRQGGCVTGCMC